MNDVFSVFLAFEPRNPEIEGIINRMDQIIEKRIGVKAQQAL